jgi:hypothetical protein
MGLMTLWTVPRSLRFFLLKGEPPTQRKFYVTVGLQSSAKYTTYGIAREPSGFVALTERLANSGPGLWRMSTKPQPPIDYLSAERSKEWIVELAGLLRQQIEALEEAAFITMNDEDAKDYEKRSKRIAELNAMLGRASRL